MVLGRLPLPSDLLEAHDLRPIRGITVGSVVPIESTHKRATQELRELRLPYAKVSHELTADLRILVCGQRHGRFKDGVHGRRIILLLSVSALGGVDSEDSWWGVAAGAPHTLKSEHTGVPNRLRPVPKAAHCPCRCMHRASHLDVSSTWLPGLMSMRCITCLLWHACVCSIVV